MTRLPLWVPLVALFSMVSAADSAWAAGDVTVKFKCQGVLHYNCTIQPDGDFSSNCALIENFFEKYYQNRTLKAKYKAQAPLSIPSTTLYECGDGDITDGDAHFSATTLTIAPGESKKQLVRAATCQPDTIDQTVSFTVVNGPVNMKIVATVDSRVHPTPSVALKSYETGTYQVKWTQQIQGATKGCDYPVVFEFSVPAPAPIVITPAVPAPVPPTPPTIKTP